MPAGVLDTEPFPVPAIVTVSKNEVLFVKVAATA